MRALSDQLTGGVIVPTNDLNAAFSARMAIPARRVELGNEKTESKVPKFVWCAYVIAGQG